MFKKALIASAMLVSVISANAAGTATFGVTGTSTPSACDVTIGTGTSDYGTITAAQRSSHSIIYGAYSMGEKTTTFTIVCGVATKVGVSFSDNKPGKLYPLDGNDFSRFGVVDGAGSTAIGSYDYYFTSILLDNVAAAGTLVTPNNATTWSNVYPNGMASNWPAPGYTMGFIKTATATTPDTFTNLTANLTTRLFVSQAYLDSSTNAVTINGSGVVTIKYL